MNDPATTRATAHPGLDAILDEAAREATLPPEREPLWRVWARRAVTVPSLVLATALTGGLLPLLLAVALVHDIARRRDIPTVRFVLALFANLVMHLTALVVLAGIFLASGRVLGFGHARERRWTYWMEGWWAREAWRTACILYRMRTVVEGGAALGAKGPVIILARHASILDTMLPFVLAAPSRRRLRHCMKRELRLDPTVDVVGRRVPTAFVARGGAGHAQQVAAVEHLLDDLDARDAVVYYPEGTRFTPEKQRRILDTLRRKDPASHTRARRLRRTLPPKLGGTLGLLEQNPGADVVFCAHFGLEGAHRLKDLLAGSLLDVTVRVRLWRVPYALIPLGRDARVEWLYDHWQRLDGWVFDQAREARRRAAR